MCGNAPLKKGLYELSWRVATGLQSGTQIASPSPMPRASRWQEMLVGYAFSVNAGAVSVPGHSGLNGSTSAVIPAFYLNIDHIFIRQNPCQKSSDLKHERPVSVYRCATLSVFAVHRADHFHAGISSSSSPTMRVAPSCLSSTIDWLPVL